MNSLAVWWRRIFGTVSTEDNAGVARYLLDCLTADQTAAVANTILADSSLSALVEIKLPVHFAGTYGLPAEVLTTARTTYFRNAACANSALLVANTGDDEEQSLKDLVSVGAPELLGQPEVWIAIAGDGLPLIDQHKQWWLKAIEALLEVPGLRSGRLWQESVLLVVTDCLHVYAALSGEFGCGESFHVPIVSPYHGTEFKCPAVPSTLVQAPELILAAQHAKLALVGANE